MGVDFCLHRVCTRNIHRLKWLIGNSLLRKTIFLFLFVCRVVIDGYPLTRKHVDVLESTKIYPVKIFEFDTDTKEVFRRALLDKESTNR